MAHSRSQLRFMRTYLLRSYWRSGINIIMIELAPYNHIDMYDHLQEVTSETGYHIFASTGTDYEAGTHCLSHQCDHVHIG
jgi:hypothetical protein